ncbi:MAG TPA: polysaccharide deacetylase family protein, partial [Clostridiales bacterium]|nr:polysaccharide deacetylase family protein [Clostridiales bacterium]
FIRALFPDIIWENSKEGIMLTIDDAPSENTFRILDALDKHKIKAAFFCTGKNIEKHFREFSAIIKAGHRIENHGFNHKRLILKGEGRNKKEICSTNDLIVKITGKKPEFFRPPYGMFNLHTKTAANQEGLKIMLWSFLTADHTQDFAMVRRLTDTYLQNNSIIVMHDNQKSSVIFDQSLEYIAKAAIEKKYFFHCF